LTGECRAGACALWALLLLYPAGLAGCGEGELHRSGAEHAATRSAVLIQEGEAALEEARRSLDPDAYAVAYDLFEAALRAAPNSTLALSGLARVHNGRHEFAAGMALARQALSIDSQLPDAHALLGDAAVELGDYPLAFEHYQAALDLRPDLGTYSRAAWLLWLTDDAERGRRLMQRAIAAGSSSAEHVAWSRARLARMLFHAGALAPAEQVVDTGLEETPGNAHLLAEKGRLRLARDDFSGAERYYRLSVEAAPSHDALAGLELLYRLQGREAEASQQFDRVVAFHTSHAGENSLASFSGPAFEHLHGDHELALFYTDRDLDLNHARREAAEAWRLTPNILVADTLAWCLYKTGEYDEAAKMIEVALSHNTPLADIHFHAGMIFAQQDDLTRARRHLQRAIDLNPAFHPVHAGLAASVLATLPEADNPADQNALVYR